LFSFQIEEPVLLRGRLVQLIHQLIVVVPRVVLTLRLHVKWVFTDVIQDLASLVKLLLYL